MVPSTNPFPGGVWYAEDKGNLSTGYWSDRMVNYGMDRMRLSIAGGTTGSPVTSSNACNAYSLYMSVLKGGSWVDGQVATHGSTYATTGYYNSNPRLSRTGGWAAEFEHQYIRTAYPYRVSPVFPEGRGDKGIECDSSPNTSTGRNPLRLSFK